MIDANKVRLMTKIAIYEKKEENRNLIVSKFYKSDYVRYNVLKTLIAATVAFWSIIGAYVFLKFDDLLAKVSEVDYFDVMYKLLGAYVFVCLGFFFFAEIVYSYRYSMAKPGLIKYNVNLKKLINLYGGKKKKKQKNPDKIVGTVVEDEIEFEFEEAPQQNNNVKIKKTDMISQRKQQEEQERNQQIIENAQRRKEWLARKAAEKAENDRRREEAKRQREQAMMEQRRAYLAQAEANNTNFVRPDFTVQGNPNNTNQNSDVNGRSDS